MNYTKLTDLYIWIAVGDNDERIIASDMDGRLIPMASSRLETAMKLQEAAQRAALVDGKLAKLIRFRREDVFRSVQ